ncbi:leu operon leader peptide, partial [Escherichia coli]|uniref:leu operon leader peptide n=1 Tax=Escherichia coli TaxID=562 RepID=UPI0027D93BDD
MPNSQWRDVFIASGLTSVFVSSNSKSISHPSGADLMTHIVSFIGLLLLNAISLRGRRCLLHNLPSPRQISGPRFPYSASKKKKKKK